jgi:aminopeptidase
MTIPDFENKLQRYADIITRVGLNVQPGQRLLINALIETAPLVRAVVRSAYRIGSPYVDIIWRDEQSNLVRFQEAPRDSFEEYSVYIAEGIIKQVQNGGAYLAISSDDPNILKDQDPELVALSLKTQRKHMKPVYDLLDRNGFNWCIAAYPSPAWAGRVFPQAGPEERQEKLWQALFQVCRIDQPDPVAAWQQQLQNFQVRKAYLTGKQYRALHYQAPGTDLTIGLADQHRWMGGSINTTSGIEFIPNLPTEEVFTLPHRQHIDGVVTASKPLSYAGVLIEDFCLTFEQGRVTKVEAGKGEEALKKLIATDDGSSSLGEVALVPQSSPVAESRILFYNTLLDENAASHIALGDGLNFALEGGEHLSQEEYHARGGNTSLVHVDFMIGSGQMDIDGVTADGKHEPVMRKGEWAF